MISLQPHLTSLIESLPSHPVEQHVLHDLISNTLEQSKNESSSENRKSHWEYLLKNEIFNLATTEGDALKEKNTTYYEKLRDMLDIVLTFTELDACEQPFPFTVLQDLLETQTITSCSEIFSWIEARAGRLTEGMVPQKGKALILLRTLNDLLRRLSKMGSTTIFCGRILTFLSGVFPLGERSGVNLRGEYGPTWEGVKDVRQSGEQKMAVVEIQPSDEGAGEKMQVDSEESKKPTEKRSDQKKEDFYNTFWSLQLPFSKPPLFSQKNTFDEFRDAVNKALPVLKEATAKERAMMGSRVIAGAPSLKRKREPDSEDANSNEYFFAKFLTSPELLDLEIADMHFRRQFLFQLLILLHHLLTFTKAAKAVWSSPRNRSLQMEFTLEPPDAQWAQETVNKAMEELRQTTPNGRAFAETVAVILEREKNWVKWKNELCSPFDKERWGVERDGRKAGLLEATKDARERMKNPPPDWEWRLGSEPLTEIWDMGYRDLHDLQNPFQPGDVKDFVKKIKQEDSRIELRKKTLAKAAERVALAQAKAAAAAAAAAAAPPPPSQPQPPSSDEVMAIEPRESPTRTSDLDVQSTGPNVVPSAPPNVALGSSIHPSLPAKPAMSPKPSSSAQDGTGVDIPTLKLVASSSPAPMAPPAPPTLPNDDLLLKYEENKQRWSWLTLRTARDQYLQHFGKIGTGDIELLAQEIEKEQQEKTKVHKPEDTPSMTNVLSAEEQRTESPISSAAAFSESQRQGDAPAKVDVEGEVKMEDL